MNDRQPVTVELSFVRATADITFAESSIHLYIIECDRNQLEPSQHGFLEWCEQELQYYGQSLCEDFELQSEDTTDRYPIDPSLLSD